MLRPLFAIYFGFSFLPCSAAVRAQHIRRLNIAKNRNKKPLKKTSKNKAMQITANQRESTEGKPFGTPPDHPTTFPMISTSWLSLGRSNHCLSPQILFNSFKKLPQILPKFIPKSNENPYKIISKPSPNPPRTLPNSIKNSKRAPKALRTRFFQFFIDFWRSLGDQKSSQNREKSKKSDEKSMSKKHMVFNTFFLDFSWVWPPKTFPKSRFFRYYLENVDFVKIVFFLKENCFFSGFELQKNH